MARLGQLLATDGVVGFLNKIIKIAPFSASNCAVRRDAFRESSAATTRIPLKGWEEEDHLRSGAAHQEGEMMMTFPTQTLSD